MPALTDQTLDLLRTAAGRIARDRPLVVLTGAGVSAESGIPTFRGADGYWTVGSRNYQPEELATYAAFREQPEVLLDWYLARLRNCRDAEPNAAHRALVDLDRTLDGAMQLVTQNIDGLHRRAGHAVERMWCIHGELERCRCANPGCPDPAVRSWPGDDPATLRCPACGDWLRPHVLWFDEYYDEEHYRIESTLGAMERCAGLVIVGTSGATTLPNLMVERALMRRVPVVVLDPEETSFAHAAGRSGHGAWVRGAAVELVPRVVAELG